MGTTGLNCKGLAPKWVTLFANAESCCEEKLWWLGASTCVADSTLTPATVTAGSKDWFQVGDDINGEAASDMSGKSLAMSSDGMILAIGANGNDLGLVPMFAWDGGVTNHVERGLDIVGEAEDDYSGGSLAMSSDGTILAIGASSNDGNGTNSGHVCVFAWDINDTNYVQRDLEINGEADYDYSGGSLGMSNDGTILAIGATDNDGNGTKSGRVRVYAWDGDDTNYVQRGLDIKGEAEYDYSGVSLFMSSDGMILAIGATGKDGNGTDLGRVHVFSWDSDDTNYV